MMSVNSEIVSIWVGAEAQEYAHDFYHLQAQQFFSEQTDPLNHAALWKDIDKKIPRMLIFDKCLPNLTRLRAVNHKKMIKKMKEYAKKENNIFHFNVSYHTQDQEQPQQPQQPQQQDHPPQSLLNWQPKESNYVLIDSEFSSGNQDHSYWEEMYARNAELSEDRIRKELQQTDYLTAFIICSDDSRSGFSYKMVEHVKDQCGKKNIMYHGFGEGQEKDNISLISSLAEISCNVDLFIPIQQLNPQISYFNQATSYQCLAPLLNLYFTPYILRQSTPNDYISNIVSSNRNILNTCYCLPIIKPNFDTDSTNIFRYADRDQEHQSMLNWANKGSLKLDDGKFLSQSWILKGHGLKLQENFHPASQIFSLKYLQGINCFSEHTGLKYSTFYQSIYNQSVQNYPFHGVLFANQCFGKGIRSLVKKINHKNKLYFQQNGWQEKVRVIADMYQEEGESQGLND